MVAVRVGFTFHQMTDKGRVTCRTNLPIFRCSNCGFEMFGPGAETRLNEAVRREYDKLPPVGDDKKR